MANLKIASPPVSAKPATAVPSNENHADGIDFAAKLKEGLAKEAKKEQTKKSNVQATNLAVPASALNIKAASLDALEGGATEELALVASEEKSTQPQTEQKGEDEKELLSGSVKKNALAGILANVLIGPSVSPTQGKMAAPAPASAELTEGSSASKQKEISNILIKPESNLSELSNLTSKLGMLQANPAETSDVKSEPFEIESLKLGEGADKPASELNTPDSKAAAPAKLSTLDYLNLRELGKKEPKSALSDAELGEGLGTQKLKQELLSKKELAQPLTHSTLTQVHLSPVKTMDAQVTAGGNGKTVLTPDSVNQLSTTVNMMSKAQQDGEIKIRLRPDHLGELVLSVKTQGNQVSIQIKAHGSEAKRIIEESLGSLKDNFAKQNLTLSQIDVVTAPNPTQTQDQGMSMNFADSRQNFGQDSSGFNQGQNTRQELHYEDVFSPSTLKPAQAARVNRYQANAGLDLIA